jgi:hypothetical protein
MLSTRRRKTPSVHSANIGMDSSSSTLTSANNTSAISASMTGFSTYSISLRERRLSTVSSSSTARASL